MAGFLAMAIEAMNQYARGTLAFAPTAFCLKDVEFISPMQIPESASTNLETQIQLRPLVNADPKPDSWFEFEVYSYEASEWRKNCRGLIRVEAEVHHNSRENDHGTGNSSSLTNISAGEFYDLLENAGYLYGPSFQKLDNLQWSSSGRVQANLKIYEPEHSATHHDTNLRAKDTAYVVHPATLDALLQLSLASIIGKSSNPVATMLPTKIKDIWLSSTGLNYFSGSSLSAIAWLDSSGKASEHSISAMTPENDPKIQIVGYEMTCMPSRQDEVSLAISPADLHTCWRPSWKALTVPPKTAAGKFRPRAIEIHVHNAPSSVIELAHTLQSRLQEDYHSTCTVIDSVRAATMPSSPVDLKIVLWDIGRRSILATLSKDDLSVIQKVFRNTNILWIQTTSPLSSDFCSQHMIDGLSKVLRQEHDTHCFATLSTIRRNTSSRTEAILRVCQVLFSESYDSSASIPQTFRETNTGDIEVSYLEEASELTKLVQVAQTIPTPEFVKWGRDTPLKLVSGAADKLDLVHFVEDLVHKRPLEDNEVEVEVKAVGLSLHDGIIGSEIAGIVTRVGGDSDNRGFVPGDRLCGFSANRNGIRTLFRANGYMLSRIPTSLSFAEAASVPINLASAWQALKYVAKLVAGDTVLVAGADSASQAAIQIAKHLGAIVFVACPADGNKLLTTQYGVPPDYILDNGDIRLAERIKRFTGGRGVDIVFNSLSKETELLSFWECLSPFGRFVETGRKGCREQPTTHPGYNRSFNAVDITEIFLSRPRQAAVIVEEAFKAFSQGSSQESEILQKVPSIETISVSAVSKALQLLQEGNDGRKIIVEMDSMAQVQGILKPKHKWVFPSDASYVIAGGLDGLGRDVAHWIVERGAKNLILLSQVTSESVQAVVAELKALGANCNLVSCDIANRKALDKAAKNFSSSLPPVRGCFYAGTATGGSAFDEITHMDWSDTITPNVSGSWNLHSIFRNTNLDFFVLLSSVKGTIGSKKEGSYAAASTYMDALAKYRVSTGLKAVSLQLGTPETERLSVEHTRPMLQMQSTYLPIQTGVFRALLEHYCDPSLPILQLEEANLAMGLRLLPVDPTQDAPDIACWRKNPMYQELRRLNEAFETHKSSAKRDPASQFASARSDQEAFDVVLSTLTDRIASTIAGIEAQYMDQSKSLQSYGVDSLQTTELQAWFSKVFSSDVPTFEILGASSLKSLAQVVTKRSPLRSK
ncbi:hypothetical protein ABW20_dc0109688 [Dactylellina cionopaga]|nr:hypothetical protein ABW20_dc0109688 [Dactylellina cionopaga]